MPTTKELSGSCEDFRVILLLLSTRGGGGGSFTSGDYSTAESEAPPSRGGLEANF